MKQQDNDLVPIYDATFCCVSMIYLLVKITTHEIIIYETGFYELKQTSMSRL